MITTHLSRRTIWTLASSLLVCLSLGNSAASDRGRSTPATDHPLDMVSTLQAASPHASLGDEQKVLGRVAGTWDVEYLDYLKDGTELHRTGRFMVEWILDGRALQELWIVDPTATGKEREVYTSVYYFEPKSRSWHEVSVDPYQASVVNFSGGAVGNDRFVLEMQDPDGKTTRWSFNDIRTDSFTWRDEQSTDGGRSWKVKSDYHMKRHGGSRLHSDRESGPRGRWFSF